MGALFPKCDKAWLITDAQSIFTSQRLFSPEVFPLPPLQGVSSYRPLGSELESFSRFSSRLFILPRLQRKLTGSQDQTITTKLHNMLLPKYDGKWKKYSKQDFFFLIYIPPHKIYFLSVYRNMNDRKSLFAFFFTEGFLL